jgi:hypothetical protein
MSPEPDATAREFHTRSFPGQSFVPSSARAMDARHIDAIFMNGLWSVSPSETTASKLLSTIIDTQVEGNPAAVEDFKKLLEKVWFQPNRGGMGKRAPELLISHVRMGQSYRPTGHYNLDRWVPAILTHAEIVGGTPADSKLRSLLETASQRPMNLIENAILQSGQPAVPDPRPRHEGRMALPRVMDTFARLIRHLLDQADWESPLSQVEAERIVLDLLGLLRTAYFVLWIQIHLNAYDSLDALREHREVPDRPRRLHFGFETERYAVKARRFKGTRSILENDLERGDYALMALSQLHEVLDCRDPLWFDEWATRTLSPEQLRKVHDWFSAYDGAMRRQGLVDAWRVPATLPSDPASLLVLMEQAIEANNRSLRPRNNQRAAYTFTWGAVPGMATAEGPRLFTNLGRGRGMGVQAMVNVALILLVGRSIMSSDRMALLLKIFEELEKIGVVFDDDTREIIIQGLERTGRIRKLSDAGESIYVSVD